MTKSIKKNTKKKKRIFLKIGAFIVLIPILLSAFGMFYKKDVLIFIQEFYEKNHNGTLKIEDIKVNAIKDFPNLNFKLLGLEHTNFDTIYNKRTDLKASEVEIILTLADVFTKHLRLKKIRLKDMQYVSTIEKGKPESFYADIKRAKQEAPNMPFVLPSWLHENKLKIQFKNIDVQIIDSVLNKAFHFTIHDFKSTVKTNDEIITGKNNMEVSIHKLGFNLDKGTFFNGALIQGTYDFRFNLHEQTIALTPFDLFIDDQKFLLAADFNLSNGAQYNFDLVNDNTNLKATKALLPNNISKKLVDYQLDKPLKTHLKLKGQFAYKDNPVVKVDFSTESNTFIFKEAFPISDITFTGHLTNDIYKNDSIRVLKKTPRDFQLNLKSLSGNLKGIDVKIKESFYRSTPETNNYVKANIDLQGKNEDLAAVLNNTDFYFNGGQFKLEALVDGDIDNPLLLLNHAQGNFKMDKTEVFFKPTKSQLPINQIDLSLNNEFAKINTIEIPLLDNEVITLRGHLKHLSSLIENIPDYPLESFVEFEANTIHVNNFMDLLNKFAPKNKTALDTRKDLHTTLAKIHNQFHPTVKMRLGKLIYNGNVLNDVITNIGFLNEETLDVKTFIFNHKGAQVGLDGEVKIPKPLGETKDPIFIDFNVNMHGASSAFNNIFKKSLLQFTAGDFSFSGHINGNIHKFNELLSNVSGNLKINKNTLYYEPVHLNIEINEMLLNIKHSTAYLEKFEVEIGEDHKLQISAMVEHFPGFLIPEDKNPNTYLQVKSKYIDLDKLLILLEDFKNKAEETNLQKKSNLYQSFKDIYGFNPNIEIDIDTLKYKDLVTNNIVAQFYFENESQLILENLGIDYKQSQAQIHGQVNAYNTALSINNTANFDINFNIQAQGETKDLNDYFGNSNFLFDSGQFKFKGNYEAKSENFVLSTSEATGRLQLTPSVIEFKAAELFIPIDTLDLAIKNNKATINSLQLRLKSNDYINVSGNIDNFSGLVSKNSEDQIHSSRFLIYSPNLDTDDIDEILLDARMGKPKPSNEAKKDLALLKNSLLDLKKSFHPELEVKIDTFSYQKFKITHLKSNLFFDQKDNIHLKNTGFRYRKGRLDLDMLLALAEIDKTSFQTLMTTEQFDIGQAAQDFDYFNIESLREAEKFEAIFNYDMAIKGQFDAKDSLKVKSLNGHIDFQIDSLKLFEFKPIVDNIKVLKKERFKAMSFQPIVEKISINNGVFSIPRTEIQSSAIDFFIEGKTEPKAFRDIWISIPLNNLKANDGIVLSEKVGYENTGSKIYIQMVQDFHHKKAKKRKLKTKIRFSNKKLRKGKTPASAID
ncbi:hypothetical protein [Algibacter mikhailovii]|uniref:AsmA-like C-terminal domain-containing protein n=1 Tax=Algibacter mikhailovii TaxID=425498 RepID=A0A918V558_9FLAO|nr:hypothetical protein [Algibacter mikhailovii]GGZ69926.1 hypothetical protein GCM10007028_03790 [Algibacter mikhailovii]